MTTRSYRRILVICFFVLGAGISVSANSSAGHVYLSGQVHQQGAVEIPAGGKLTVTQAIISSGGFGDAPDLRRIRILRRNGDGTSQFIEVDWVKIMGGGPPEHPAEARLDMDVVLQAGDIIMVPLRLVKQ